MNLNTQLLKVLGLSWLAFLLTGVLITWLFPIPNITLLIDRSYCPAKQWQQASQTYAQLYQQHQWRQLHLQSVILFSTLGQEVFNTPPVPKTIQTLSTYGQTDGQRQAELQKTHPKTKLLSCQ